MTTGEKEFGATSFAFNAPKSTEKFGMTELKIGEIRKVVRKTRAASAPGPSGAPKNYTSLGVFQSLKNIS